eukprot:CAMPEP_0172526020 /NCGR_PEP_ID=MMETSP1067-20121228/1039_1 /TAXON_ID=265564 ORGANISM="Thalassiosira punctigera, Strain Tpunct2005C2" /NCGR_SAMPLE_ID=MMETSP1067 /ASSEMBLY_ACC=CAM_ASM_000444 /LENGTH=506 /DNA_ID=CAMNT_0013309437 /DNA_START=111 /DNA_END=1631 /DNA_ORIENTATION=+
MGAANNDNEEFEIGDETDNASKNDARGSPAAPSSAGPQSSSTKKSAPADSSVVFSPELLAMYYSRLFPYHILYSWLSYDPSAANPGGGKGSSTGKSANNSSACTFPRREFSMTIEPTPGNEVYIRYQSFLSQEELTSAIMKRRPTKIDIGAVFNYPPKDNKSLPSGKLQTQERELVFDIDLTDYDGVRNCGCEGAKICPRCWTFMGMAMEVMDEGLRQDFGFEHVAWFYSGRRGVHCWVCDDGARKLTNEARSAVATYFEVNLGSDKNKGFRLSSPLHPMLSRAYKILDPQFAACVLPEEGHGLLATPASWTKLLLTLPEAALSVAKKMGERWGSTKDRSTPQEKWRELKAALMSFIGKGSNAKKVPKTLSNTDRIRIEQWPVETVFKYTYPRLDINVSKMQNHLLKSPFCVHPKTGRVCVPIEVDDFQTFDPFRVPTLAQLMRELDEYEVERGDKDEAVAYDWQKTSLKEPFEQFQKKFLVPLMNEERRMQREERERKAAIVGDF